MAKAAESPWRWRNIVGLLLTGGLATCLVLSWVWHDTRWALGGLLPLLGLVLLRKEPQEPTSAPAPPAEAPPPARQTPPGTEPPADLETAFALLESGTHDLRTPSQRVTSARFLKSSARMLAEGQLGPYKILKELGRGSSGVVYKALWEPHNKLVAMKILQRLAEDKERRRFIREVKAVSQLEHPHIVPIYEVDTLQGRPYYSMRFIEGHDFEHSLRTNGALLTELLPGRVRVLIRIAQALHYLHERGYIHRDVKPANILLDQQDRPYLVDFGFAKHTALDIRITQPGTTVGTPVYMAPEQILGRQDQLGPHTDVFSLGNLLYQALTGELPHARPEIAQIVQSVLAEAPVPPSQVRGGVPAELEQLCLAALTKPIARRLASAAVFAQRLSAWLKKETAGH